MRGKRAAGRQTRRLRSGRRHDTTAALVAAIRIVLLRHLGVRLARGRRRRGLLHLVRERHGGLRLRRGRLLLEEEAALVRQRVGRHNGDRGAAAGHGVRVDRGLPHHEILLSRDLHGRSELGSRCHLLLVVEVLVHHDLLLLVVRVTVLRPDADGERHGACRVLMVVVLRRGDVRRQGRGPNVSRQLLARGGDLVADPFDLHLQHGDVGHAAIDGVADARVGLVRQGVYGVLPLQLVQVVEELRDVAGAEDAVHARELARIVGREVGREHASLRALAAQQLTRGTGRVRRRHPAASPRAGSCFLFLLLLLLCADDIQIRRNEHWGDRDPIPCIGSANLRRSMPCGSRK
jgi:hypothetical protein